MRVARGLLVLVLLTAAVAFPSVTPASARSRELWSSPDLNVRGKLIGRTLVIAHKNLSDYWIEFDCTLKTLPLSGGTQVRTTSSQLSPGETWSRRFRRQARLPKTTRCRVSVDQSHTVVWRSDTFVVLASTSTYPDGSPQTVLEFYNKTPHQLRMTCTWWWGSTFTPTLAPQVWSPDLGPYEWRGLGSNATLSSLSSFRCESYQAGQPIPIAVPSGVQTLFDSGTFLATIQSYQDTYSRYSIHFINRLDVAVTASCTYTVVYPSGDTSPLSWSQSMHAYGIGGATGGTQGTGTTSANAMSCTVTPTS